MSHLTDHLNAFEQLPPALQMGHLKTTFRQAGRDVSEMRFALLDYGQRCALHDELHGGHPLPAVPAQPVHVARLEKALRDAFEAGESYGACSESGSGPAAVEAMKRDSDWWVRSELPALVERIEDDLKCTDH